MFANGFCDWAQMTGWGWGMMGFAWLFSLVVVALVAWAVWAAIRPGADRSSGGALGILEERFARGEISPEEYRERRSVLETGR